MRVAVLGGGRSSEHDVSLDSAAAIRAGLAEAGHEPLDVLVERGGGWTHAGKSLAIAPGAGVLDADVVFPALHGPFGEDGTVQGLLEIADVPYVGAGVLASALCMEKLTFKELMAQAGIPQVGYVGLHAGADRAAADTLGTPVFVKPARLGSSVGISKVSTPDELPAALDAAFEHDPLVIVEEMATGLEVECSVIGNGEPLASEPGEIVLRTEWYDYEAKYTPGGMELVVPARIDDRTRERVRELARDVFLRVGCTGLARVDFFVTDAGEVLVNELNTIPGFTSTSVYARLFEASGIPYTDLLERLAELAVERFDRRSRLRF